MQIIFWEYWHRICTSVEESSGDKPNQHVGKLTLKVPSILSSMYLYNQEGHAVAQVALRYKPEGRGFDSRRGVIEIFHRLNPFDRTTALGSTQPLIEMSTTGICWRVKGGRWVGLKTLPPSIWIWLFPFRCVCTCNKLIKLYRLYTTYN